VSPPTQRNLELKLKLFCDRDKDVAQRSGESKGSGDGQTWCRVAVESSTMLNGLFLLFLPTPLLAQILGFNAWRDRLNELPFWFVLNLPRRALGACHVRVDSGRLKILIRLNRILIYICNLSKDTILQYRDIFEDHKIIMGVEQLEGSDTSKSSLQVS
jgi:hypothetical protein